jgi:hypothetical protein
VSVETEVLILTLDRLYFSLLISVCGLCISYILTTVYTSLPYTNLCLMVRKYHNRGPVAQSV